MLIPARKNALVAAVVEQRVGGGIAVKDGHRDLFVERGVGDRREEVSGA